nr:LPS-assembly protein LptD [Allorhizobium sonneratiae]
MRRLFTALLAGAAFGAPSVSAVPVYAQQAAMKGRELPQNAKLMLAANELTYNKDAQVVTALGGVQMNYGGYQMVAEKVEYDQKTGRMMAYGKIELIEPDGNHIFADKLDVTNDFAKGFIDSLRIQTLDATSVIARKGERIDKDTMVLYKGVYTACLRCTEDGHTPLWQIKAERVIENGKTHTIRLEHAQFQLFGRSVAYIPAMEVPDSTVKRKSGFLFPTMSTTQKLGFGVTVPYYWAISPQTDATIKMSGYTAQGVLMDTEVRHRYENGQATFRFAAIDQTNPGKFDSGTSDSEHKFRGMVSTTGLFNIAPRWTFGWNVMAQTDNNFSRTYDLEGLSDQTITDQVFLTGLGERNFFDMRAYYFQVQDADTSNEATHQQPIVGPVVDYSYYAPEPVMGGELSAKMNFTSLTRYNDDILTLDNGKQRFDGLKGNDNRLTSEVQWKRTFETPQGLLLTPIFDARGDLYNVNMRAPSGYDGDYNDSAAIARSMVTAGLEMRYPWLLSTPGGSHVIEPIAQIFVRPDEQDAGGLPNEDAQSFVFDASNLFQMDKFSGYDRVEGGTRANVGLRYTGSLDNGYTMRSIFGQSYQLAGKNSFATSDLVYAGNESGLEDAVSDYVGMVGLDTPYGVSFSLNGRFDHKDFTVKRTDSDVGYRNDIFKTDMIFSQIAAQPDYGYDTDRQELQNTTSVKIADSWSVFGSLAWDMKNHYISRYGAGFSYDDKSTIFSLVYKYKYDPTSETANDWSIGARLTFRTLGDVRVGDTDVTTYN